MVVLACSSGFGHPPLRPALWSPLRPLPGSLRRRAAARGRRARRCRCDDDGGAAAGGDGGAEGGQPHNCCAPCRTGRCSTSRKALAWAIVGDMYVINYVHFIGDFSEETKGWLTGNAGYLNNNARLPNYY